MNVAEFDRPNSAEGYHFVKIVTSSHFDNAVAEKDLSETLGMRMHFCDIGVERVEGRETWLEGQDGAASSGYLVHELHSLVEGEGTVLLVPAGIVQQRNNFENKMNPF